MSSNRVINVDLFQKIFDFFDKNPDRWDQENWFDVGDEEKWEAGESALNCGATGCVAGWAVVLDDRIQLGEYGAITDVTGLPDAAIHFEEYGSYNLARTAAEALGLTEEESDDVFYYMYNHDTGGRVTLDDMKRRVSEVTGHDFMKEN